VALAILFVIRRGKDGAACYSCHNVLGMGIFLVLSSEQF